MSLYTRICVALFGICGGIIVMFAVDMLFNSGRFVAHSLHTRTPDCSGACHGSTERQNTAAATAVMALPTVQTADRPAAVATGPWGYPLLGVQVEAGGRD